jgi:8-oxo-dGTP pyrophosphatase MutT (NUDIX family)
MSKQNYTIFMNQVSMILTKSEQPIPTVFAYAQFSKSLHKIISLNQQKTPTTIEIKCSSPKKLVEYIKSRMPLIQAAGGIVEHNGEFLYIFRRGHWDLPKGKIEAGEKIEQAAIREVNEECGISKLRITKPLPTSYHIYFEEGRHVIKETFWFKMKTEDNLETLKPQLEEGITEIKFAHKGFLLTPGIPTYQNLIELVSF